MQQRIESFSTKSQSRLRFHVLLVEQFSQQRKQRKQQIVWATQCLFVLHMFLVVRVCRLPSTMMRLRSLWISSIRLLRITQSLQISICRVRRLRLMQSAMVKISLSLVSWSILSVQVSTLVIVSVYILPTLSHRISRTRLQITQSALQRHFTYLV